MPPKKEAKEKQVKGDEVVERLTLLQMVLNYMKEMDRPYASADVVANLKNKIPKTAAVKILATLAEGQIKSVLSQLEEGKKSLRHLQYELSSKTALPKTVELEKEIGRVKSENEITLSALAPFRGEPGGQSTITPMSAEDIQRIDKDFIRWRKEWVDRRKVYKDQLVEFGQVSNITEFEEELGVYKDGQIATEVEQGEFCKLPIVNRPRPKFSSAKVHNSSLKRASSAAGVVGEDGKKKKMKKV
ncbi:hypothetical protein I307_00166 [Cryptococcus deuterogattii 99/473]|uniref:Homologous-pairing protein 2 winged helix domain-containing protein n=1 Tax=Cryptococcus deuterogattii Ram5 TaxID=1296110 RepID=A0A0D0TCD3_9TREE|nr:hypothetical protein I352_00638 [Cryptococcus deuterogattii MMRL2647]KIR43792.1 hypothetical protein I313_00637 [Cryptococcus deuterogattii Ram5]KIR75124.1 hypothetical protein I310_01401 [Cryptococcus deuterogattii CA1014]KIR98115.1 hypothetical protein L804_04576 [Cryptococcus deuterogattii 2001/935-1]KIY60366.1 hypothetical protein I307_00166 [Cryptococcus deuterogattii 99/473]